jgi:hypothetical protein
MGCVKSNDSPNKIVTFNHQTDASFNKHVTPIKDNENGYDEDMKKFSIEAKIQKRGTIKRGSLKQAQQEVGRPSQTPFQKE